MKYVKKFNNHNDYNTYITGNPVLPNVSYCETLDEVHYNPWTWANTYFTISLLETSTVSFSYNGVDYGVFTGNNLQYSIDEGTTWETLLAGSSSISAPAGTNILFKCENPTISTTQGIGHFSSTGNFEVKGNIMSLLYGDNFINLEDLTGKNYVFYDLFYQCTKLVLANNLILPATTLATRCYEYMFHGCTSLITTPKLPATTLVNYCYSSMFSGCTSLIIGPELPATTLADYCYNSMFYGCRSLTTAPELPSTTLAPYCYLDMFKNCTSLVNVSKLSATTVATYCYSYMFENCTSLTIAPELPATTLANYCYSGMFHGCTSLTTAPTLPATTLNINCYQSMFEDCTSLTTAPELPATILADSCYHNMFYNCASLNTAPELPATTLVSSCYKYMFTNCNNLNYIKAMFTTTPSNSYTQYWVSGVAATGTFVKNVNATWTTTGYNGVPSGWTVQTASE